MLAESGEAATVSGKIVDVSAKSVTIRNGRPYLISPGTMLQVEEGSLVLRGDMLATLVFEREKQVISFKVFRELKNFLKQENLKIVLY